MGIGDNSRLICEDLGSVAGLYEVAGQSGYSLNVFNLEQIMDAPSDDDIRTLVESSRDETLIERRRQSLVVNYELSFSISWLGEVLALELLSRVLGVASRSLAALPLAEVSFEHDAFIVFEFSFSTSILSRS